MFLDGPVREGAQVANIVIEHLALMNRRYSCRMHTPHTSVGKPTRLIVPGCERTIMLSQAITAKALRGKEAPCSKEFCCVGAAAGV